MDEILKAADKIFLKVKCDCQYCIKTEIKFLEVKASIKDAIEALVAANYEPDCSMLTLTGFEKLSDDFFRPIFYV